MGLPVMYEAALSAPGAAAAISQATSASAVAKIAHQYQASVI
jgi:hypothetical protein